VFAALPRLLERAGTGPSEGSITALYTVLVEGDDLSDPIADSVRSILDGHIVLTREMAEKGHFPAIDVLQSVSRLAPEIAKPEDLKAASSVRDMMSAYREVADLIQVGAYVTGSDPRVEAARTALPAIEAFLKQGISERTTSGEARTRLQVLARAAAGGRK
jgi:flagellar biosynthesis/type III secretory pathway ATPase